jgi:predicted nucleotidyltransferase
MAYASKEEAVLELFYNYPTKHWRFKELKQKTSLPDSKLAKWLRKFQKEKLILRKKPEKRMPHYISNRFDTHFQNKKKLFSMKLMLDAGLLDHLASLEKAKAVILFGSFVRWDWYYGSDIDLFIYGDASGLETHYGLRLGHEIQPFECKTGKDLERYSPDFARNVLRGIVVKGEIPSELIRLGARKDR